MESAVDPRGVGAAGRAAVAGGAVHDGDGRAAVDLWVRDAANPRSDRERTVLRAAAGESAHERRADRRAGSGRAVSGAKCACRGRGNVETRYWR